MVELRKRKAPAQEGPPPAKKSNLAKSMPSSKKEVSSVNGSAPASKVESGSTIDLDHFAGEVETQEGVKTTLKKLMDESESGVVLFTYPKASTPGCTTQACLFRDEYSSLTSTGFSIYGLSTDSSKSNTSFKSKHSLPYTLLCDPAATLIKAIGMKKTPGGTIRGVFVVGKDGKVNAVSPGGPAATVDVVRKLVEANNKVPEDGDVAQNEGSEEGVKESNSNTGNTEHHNANGDEAKAEVAAEVADTAQQLDDGAAE